MTVSSIDKVFIKMEILGIGPLELLLIVLLAVIVLGPKDIQKVAKSLGRELNKLVRSDTWKSVQQASERVKNLPTELMRDAQLDELKQSLQNPPDESQKIIPTPPDEKSPPDSTA
jgi:Sec-independent protein translocase protein TatA